MGMLSNLSHLQYLLVDGDLKIKGEKVARLSKLETFKGVFDDIQGYNYFVKSQDFQILTNYEIAVREAGFSIMMDMIDPKNSLVCINKCDLGKECIVLPDNLQNLAIDEGENMRSSLNKAAVLGKTTKLSCCGIRDCEYMECVVDLDSSSCLVLDKLEELCLWGLPKLTVLVRVEGVTTPPHVFSNLKRLRVYSGLFNIPPIPW
ncbi:hypothetical protein SLE2022_316450 [Rubroshorea leprosula]